MRRHESPISREYLTLTAPVTRDRMCFLAICPNLARCNDIVQHQCSKSNHYPMEHMISPCSEFRDINYISMDDLNKECLICVIFKEFGLEPCDRSYFAKPCSAASVHDPGQNLTIMSRMVKISQLQRSREKNSHRMEPYSGICLFAENRYTLRCNKHDVFGVTKG
ncbi:uncharacterized protein BT62DRAFT_1013733 [Guyanagaster necrorhizus]|uniref:Uncharacterized protein n=1 Tax=Guyanagaster necrorhizus TaxID=856835 RepID=A0A9P7VFH1_9AGAR|nr:uncharacterized protein BT62DRAFT_1013733 [Guyanagaster necrorhizus MCA 3950]KAG7439585.1 hypothetical protein BT62DRAFT_1013733 [Guyanagaster necrorhizus MCA 3950]